MCLHPILFCAAAAVLRQIYVRQGLGVGQLRMKFGGRNKRKGCVPEHFAKSSGGLIRHIMKQFEAVGFCEKHTGEQGDTQQPGGRVAPVKVSPAKE